ncbi:MAG: hypothetical protein U1E91_01775 [Moraxella sp.]
MPESTAKNYNFVLPKVNMVIGTTGLNDEQNAILKQASEKIAIVYAGNYSTGVHLTLLLEMAAKALVTAPMSKPSKFSIINTKLCHRAPLI